MHGQGFFMQAFIYLAAAAVAVPLARRLGLGSVLGYLMAGVAIGPFALGLVGEEGAEVMHFAEFGVVMMLFLVGLELRPALLWRLRGPILGAGGAQVATTTLLISGAALAVGLPWREALAVGMLLSLSSTALALQSLNEKGLLGTAGGQTAFAVLLLQDLAVIPMLAVLPMLATAAPAAAGGGHHSLVEGLPGWLQTLVVLGAVAAVVVLGRFLVRPAFRFIAAARLRELFTAFALLLVIGIALLMTMVGLSPAMGTFLAGVVLADSEYRHELEGDIEPFKGLLLGVFFIAVGASIDFGLVAAQPALVLGLVCALVAVKLGVQLGVGKGARLGLDHNLVASVSLAQGGEFAFVLFSFTTQAGVLPTELTATLTVVVALSMALTPLLTVANERLLMPRVGTREKGEEREADEIHEENPVILAGFGRVGSIVGRFLRANGVRVTVLDHDADHVDLVRRLGIEAYYGDATRLDLLHAAGAGNARAIILTINDHEKLMEMVHTIRRHFPDMSIIARAPGRPEAHDLIEAGVEHVVRETLDGALRMGAATLGELGTRAYAAHRAARIFRRRDEALVHEQLGLRHDRDDYISRAREQIRTLEELMQSELREESMPVQDEAWDTEALRQKLSGPDALKR